MGSGRKERRAVVPRADVVVPGRLVALGAALPCDGRVSWVADAGRGYSPLNAYLLLDDDRALLVDTGAPAFEAALLDQVREHLPADSSLSLCLTRIVEFDSFGNAGAVLRTFDVETTYAQFPPDEWVYYRHGHDPNDPPATTAWRPLRGGMEVPIGGESQARRTLEALNAPLRLLATTWLYDRELKALFTSDAFGHVRLARRDGPRAVTADTDDTTVEDVRAHLLAKFDWLSSADLGPLREQLTEIFEEREVEIVAPSYGRVLLGRDVVARHYELVQDALTELDAAATEGALR